MSVELFIALAVLAAIYGTLSIVAASEPSLWERPPVRRRYVRGPVVIIRPDPANVRPIGAPERVAFPRRTGTGRGSL